MKLDRNINADRKGKYAIVKLRSVHDITILDGDVDKAIKLLEKVGVLNFGTNPGEEFFVLMLKDRHAGDTLRAYADSVRQSPFVDEEYARDILALASKADEIPNRKRPD